MKKIIFLFAFVIFQSSLIAQTFPNSFTDGKYITVNGAKLWVVLVGKGEPIIIIPGGPGGNHLGYRRFDSLANTNTIDRKSVV